MGGLEVFVCFVVLVFQVNLCGAGVGRGHHMLVIC